jgi:hypothetical protein
MLKRILACLISAPLLSLFLILIEIYVYPPNNPEEYYKYWPLWGRFEIETMIQLLIYFVLGIPTSLLIDYLYNKIGVRSAIRLYFIKLLLYTLVAVSLGSMLAYENSFEAILQLGIIPVLTYFHVLFLIRREYKITNL